MGIAFVGFSASEAECLGYVKGGDEIGHRPGHFFFFFPNPERLEQSSSCPPEEPAGRG